MAVVAEDVLGNYDPAVRSVSAQSSTAGVGEVLNLSVVCGEYSLVFHWDAPADGVTFLDYYAVYQDTAILTNVTGWTPVRTSTTTNITIDAFENYTNYYFAVVAVNIADGYNPEVIPVMPDLDLDDDGFTNDDEVDVYGTDPYDADTDHDGLSDYEEIFTTNTDPLNPDMDDDQLLDGAEIAWGTDPEIRDSDLDLLGDGWEVEYGLNPLVTNNITLDVDEDGYDYYAEYLADTNPTNALSFFQISGITPGPPIEVFFDSSAHRVYSLLWQTNLFTSGWILHDTSQDVRGSGVETSLPDPPPVAESRFYKVNVDLP